MADINLALRYACNVVSIAEGYRAFAYFDALARVPVWTIGYGTTRINGKPVTKGMTCTKAEAEAWLVADMTEAAHTAVAAVCVPLNSFQLGALISLIYNIGSGNFQTSHLRTVINMGRYREAADLFPAYDHAGGVEVAGLRTRRLRERTLFLMGCGVFDPQASLPPSDADRLNELQLTKIQAAVAASTPQEPVAA